MSTSFQVGSAVGLASMTAVATAFGAGHLGDALAQTNGFSAGLLGAAGMALTGAVIAGRCLHSRRPEQSAPVEHEVADVA